MTSQSITFKHQAYLEAKRRAYREAGHAVASCLIRTKGMADVPPEDYPQLVSSFEYVTIEGKGPDWGNSKSDWRNLTCTLVVLLTGYVAEQSESSPQDDSLPWSSSLIKQGLELARRRVSQSYCPSGAEHNVLTSDPYTDQRAKEFLVLMLDLAKNVYYSHSWYVDYVAEALLEKKTLSQKQVFDIIELTKATDDYLNRADIQSNATWRWQRPDLEPNLYDLEYVEAQQKKVVAVAQDMLDGKIGVIKGSRLLSGLKSTVTKDEGDPDFLTFVGIDSQTDHLPVDVERKWYARDALIEKDKEIKELED